MDNPKLCVMSSSFSVTLEMFFLILVPLFCCKVAQGHTFTLFGQGCPLYPVFPVVKWNSITGTYNYQNYFYSQYLMVRLGLFHTPTSSDFIPIQGAIPETILTEPHLLPCLSSFTAHPMDWVDPILCWVCFNTSQQISSETWGENDARYVWKEHIETSHSRQQLLSYCDSWVCHSIQFAIHNLSKKNQHPSFEQSCQKMYLRATQFSRCSLQNALKLWQIISVLWNWTHVHSTRRFPFWKMGQRPKRKYDLGFWCSSTMSS